MPYVYEDEYWHELEEETYDEYRNYLLELQEQIKEELKELEELK